MPITYAHHIVTGKYSLKLVFNSVVCVLKSTLTICPVSQFTLVILARPNYQQLGAIIIKQLSLVNH